MRKRRPTGEELRKIREGRLANKKGKNNELRVLSLLNGILPPWVNQARLSDHKEDQIGWDIVLEADVFSAGIQVKSSENAKERWDERWEEKVRDKKIPKGFELTASILVSDDRSDDDLVDDLLDILADLEGDSYMRMKLDRDHWKQKAMNLEGKVSDMASGKKYQTIKRRLKRSQEAHKNLVRILADLAETSPTMRAQVLERAPWIKSVLEDRQGERRLHNHMCSRCVRDYQCTDEACKGQYELDCSDHFRSVEPTLEVRTPEY